MRNLFILGCAALLAIGLSVGAYAGSIVDGDGDGVPDSLDNCLGVPNGPLALDPNGCGQFDVDANGYGNACDPDITGNTVVDLPDLGAVLGDLGAVPPLGTSDPVNDISCNDVVDLPDLGRVLSQLGDEIGVDVLSGLPCAGTPGCLN